ncbi:hypothetical protein BSTP3_082 [Bacillus phage BSTP3]|nr:hypothetical protein BSTP3_082 [Bacillus phage BSTP3]
MLDFIVRILWRGRQENFHYSKYSDNSRGRI